MNIYAIDGAESVGKSTVLKLVQYSPHFEKDCFVMPDLARRWYEKNIITPAEMSKQDHERKQLEILHEYLTYTKEAEEQGKDVLVDSSLITMAAYSVDCVRQEYLQYIHDVLFNSPHRIKAAILSPYLDIEKDPIRFLSDTYRHTIHKRIMNIINAAGIEAFIPNGGDSPHKAKEIVTFFNSELFPEEQRLLGG